MIPRWSLPVLFFLLLLGGAWSLWLEASKGWPAGLYFGSGGAICAGVKKRSAGDLLPPATMASDGGTARPAAEVFRPNQTIALAPSAVLAEEIELRALGAAQALTLSEGQWAALAEVTLCHQAIRHAFEAEIAVVTPLSDGRVRMEIPVYADAGAALRREFYRALLKELGGDVAEEVLRKLSPELEGRFAGFGAAAQTLDFSKELPNEVGGGSVTRTAVYWDEAVEGARLRVRKETFFPAMEDPEGAQWGPLLVRLEKTLGKKARG